MKIHILKYILIIAPVFYQLDYRQRSEVEVSLPGISGFAVKKSFETRYRPLRETQFREKEDAKVMSKNLSGEFQSQN